MSPGRSLVGLFALLLTVRCALLDLPFLPAEKTGPGAELALLLLVGSGALGGSGSATASCSGGLPQAPAYLADTVTSAPGSLSGGSFDDPSRATNGICGAGNDSGSLDVYSLEQTGARSVLTLEWAGKKVSNGVGVDFVVFENAFRISGSSTALFMDPLIVEVSRDNSKYCGFAPDYTASPESSYSNNPAHWQRFAGRTPVLYNVLTNPLSADAIFDSTQAGGDGFDLSDLSDSNAFSTGCDTAERNAIQSSGFIYLRLTAATARQNPDTAAAFLAESVATGPDIDGVVARHLLQR
ncbi:MAG: LIC_13355 family lipoprotein [Spirochaetales bacterium]|nr:LIC_13355 family lipoprotein [Spirochaetales bacterium]